MVSALLLVTLAAVSGYQTARDPDTVGVVAARERVAVRTDRYTLSDGRQLDIDYNASRQLVGTGGEVGDLLLVGRDAQGVWYGGLRGEAGCYVLDSYGTDEGMFIVFPSGIRLPKAPDFDPGGITDGQCVRPGDGFCIDAQGRVVRYGVQE